MNDNHVSTLPQPNTFERGDFLWPKKPGQYVPYHSGAHSSFTDDKERWSAERDEFLGALALDPVHFTPGAIQRLGEMSYREFYARYTGDQKSGHPGVYLSGSGLYVGHVGILDLDAAGVPWVIEALSQRGVIMQSYADWLKSRPGEIVWHGRVSGFNANQRARIAVESKEHLGQPYNFWNFDLADESGFYCSKLAWWCIRQALNIAIDGNPNPKRLFWFSPKQLLYAKKIARLHDPGPYLSG